MVQVIDDLRLAGPARCRDCEVSWAGDEPCWMCGQEVPTVAERAMDQMREALANMSPALEDFINAHKEPGACRRAPACPDARRSRGAGPAARRLDGRRR